MNYVGTWGMYNWYPEAGYDLIYPDEHERAKPNPYPGNVFYCSEITPDGYLVLNSADRKYRVKPDIYRVLPRPVFKYGDLVRDKSKPEQVGTIRAITWHFKNNREFYGLRVNGKNITKYFWYEDLELVTAFPNG